MLHIQQTTEKIHTTKIDQMVYYIFFYLHILIVNQNW